MPDNVSRARWVPRSFVVSNINDDRLYSPLDAIVKMWAACDETHGRLFSVVLIEIYNDSRFLARAVIISKCEPTLYKIKIDRLVNYYTKRGFDRDSARFLVCVKGVR